MLNDLLKMAIFPYLMCTELISVRHFEDYISVMNGLTYIFLYKSLLMAHRNLS